jgi:hypothetical protein
VVPIEADRVPVDDPCVKPLERWKGGDGLAPSRSAKADRLLAAAALTPDRDVGGGRGSRLTADRAVPARALMFG